MLYNRSLLVMYFKCNNVYMSTPNSQLIPPLLPPAKTTLKKPDYNGSLACVCFFLRFGHTIQQKSMLFWWLKELKILKSLQLPSLSCCSEQCWHAPGRAGRKEEATTLNTWRRERRGAGGEEREVPLQGTPGNHWFYVTPQSILWPPESSVTVGK